MAEDKPSMDNVIPLVIKDGEGKRYRKISDLHPDHPSLNRSEPIESIHLNPITPLKPRK